MDVYGLIGDPVTHSASPAIFEAAFEAGGDPAVYGTFPVAADELEAAIAGAEALGVAGLNVTAPHKQTVMPHLEPTSRADTIGAVNLIDFDAEVARGHNTDVVAMQRVLTSETTDAGRALVIGAGGAARAYVHALAEADWSIRIANRTIANAVAVAERYGNAEGIPLTAADEHIDDADLIVNATPVGQDDPTSAPIPTTKLSDRHLVIDAVYRPRITRLLRTAREGGARVIPGTRLLLEQAAAGYRRWRGRPPPKDAMRIALMGSCRAR